MVEFVFEDWKKIVIHETIKYDLDNLFKDRITGIPPGTIPKPFLWANGVVFDRRAMPPTDEVIKLQLEGIVHWSSLEFAFMPTYQTPITVEGTVIAIVDVSSNKILSDLTNSITKKFA